tara:strand:+ start:150 stop:290 length:141 start_codon:yes stop_codon:yes gene_type:complete
MNKKYKPMKKDYGAGHKRSALRDAVKKKKATMKKKQTATYTSKDKA